MYKNYQAEQILLTEDMKTKREDEIIKKTDVSAFSYIDTDNTDNRVCPIQLSVHRG